MSEKIKYYENFVSQIMIAHQKTLIQIYNVLIRSIIEYSVIFSPIISKTNLNALQI
jgi:hypothetical protein